jgi:broad-specificity NMP kinase
MTGPIDLLLVRGATGVGKRDAVRVLRPQLSNGAVIDVEMFRDMFARPSPTDRQQHLIAMHVARAAAMRFFHQQVRPVIIIDTFTSGKLTGFVADLSCTYRIASLFMDPNALRGRLLQRGASTRDVESATMINAEIAVRRHERDKPIDTTGRDPEAIAASLRRWLRAPE